MKLILLILLFCMPVYGQWGREDTRSRPKWGRTTKQAVEEEEEEAVGGLSEIAGLELWFEGDLSICTIAKDGSNLIASWQDQTETLTMAQVSAARKPLWVETVAAANDAAGVQLDGTTDSMEGDLDSNINQPFTICFIATEPSDNGSIRRMISDPDAGKNYLQQQGANPLNRYDVDFGSSDQRAGSIVGGNPIARWILEIDGASSKFYKNGNLEDSGTAGANAIEGFNFGSNANESNYYINTTMILLAIFDHAPLRSGVKDSLNSYSNDKFGVEF